MQSSTYPTDCPPGSYCPMNSSYANQFLCPVGTFNEKLNITDESSCEMCTGGHYCEIVGLSSPSGQCNGGFYCTKGGSIASPLATYSFSNCEGFYNKNLYRIFNSTLNNVCPRGEAPIIFFMILFV